MRTASFAGYASLFGRVDLSGDRVRRGAFAASLARRGAGGIRLLWQHDPARPIGIWDEIAEDGVGLRVRGRFATDSFAGREAATLVAEGALDGLSIGFRTVRGRRDPRSAVRDLTEIDLWEISLVTFPQLDGARVLALAAEERPPAAPRGDTAALLRRAAGRISTR